MLQHTGAVPDLIPFFLIIFLILAGISGAQLFFRWAFRCFRRYRYFD